MGKNGADEMKFQLSMFGKSYVCGHFLIHGTCKQTNIHVMLTDKKLLWPSKRQIVKKCRRKKQINIMLTNEKLLWPSKRQKVKKCRRKNK